MANAQTEHSKALRAKTANERNKRLREAGLVKAITLQLPTETAEEFNAILKELGNSRTESVKTLCEFYRLHS
ncbi:Uncharacterised protein [Haemophilus parahaemolyticus]|uniref:Protein CopB n=1 Tax=Haemophilus parahaemolyticus TaxID=735 RepID=A0A377I458_HAEPH|nr:hypothetical protein [Haemophilus parahaemolyticus]STO64780.1 Uncharacterised protein [Haemophilus parahaemolyticus]